MKLNEKQLQQVDAQVKRLLKSGSFYGEVYRKAGISGVSSQEDFEKLPFSSKDDLRNAYPLGIQAVPEEEVVRIHSSSGTTGKPVIIPYTAKDVDDWAIMFARCYETAGITNKDRIQITPAYGLWTAGIGFQLGAESFTLREWDKLITRTDDSINDAKDAIKEREDQQKKKEN